MIQHSIKTFESVLLEVCKLIRPKMCLTVNCLIDMWTDRWNLYTWTTKGALCVVRDSESLFTASMTLINISHA